jgi:alcohol dehydrogenase class IV
VSVAFEFATAGKVLFGAGVCAQLGELTAKLGRRALLVTGRSAVRAERAREFLAASLVETTTLAIAAEPSTDDARQGVALARGASCNVVVAIGGGSALDAGKAIAALLANEGQPEDYLEVVGAGRPLMRRALPCIAVPTTAGTGSEVTRNAVLEAPEQRVKVSLRSHLMLPDIALVDPELTLSVPPRVTASTGFDALSQVIEPFVSNRTNPITDGLCREGIRRSARSLRRAYEHGDDLAAREDLCLTSLFGGMALANAKLGAVHGFAGPIGGAFHSPHGETCAALLPHVMAVNIRALRARQPSSSALARYAEVARLLTDRPQAAPEDGIAWVRELAAALTIPGLRSYGVTPSDFATLADKANLASSMQGNPIALEREELLAILEAAF